MMELFYALLILSLLGVLILAPVLIVLNRKYANSLNALIHALPEAGFARLREQSREGIKTLKEYFEESFKALYKQPDYLINLIVSAEFDAYGVKNLRDACYKDYKRYKAVSFVLAGMLLFLIVAAIGITLCMR